MRRTVGPHVRTALLALLALGAASATSGLAVADPLTKPQSRAEIDAAQDAYRTAWDSCKKLTGTAKSICQAEARGHYKVARTQMELRNAPSPKNENRLQRARAESQYEVSIEKCAELAGGARDVCRRDAKAALSTTRSSANAARAESH